MPENTPPLQSRSVYDYRSHGQHAKALFGVLFGIFHRIFFFKNVIKSIKNSLKCI